MIHLLLLLITPFLHATSPSGVWSGTLTYQCPVYLLVHFQPIPKGVKARYILSDTVKCYIPQQLVLKASEMTLEQSDNQLTGLSRDRVQVLMNHQNNLITGEWKKVVSGPFELRPTSLSEADFDEVLREQAGEPDKTIVDQILLGVDG